MLWNMDTGINNTLSDVITRVFISIFAFALVASDLGGHDLFLYFYGLKHEVTKSSRLRLRIGCSYSRSITT